MASLAACGACHLGAGAVAPALGARSRNTPSSGRRVVVVRATRCSSQLTRSDPLHPNLSVDDRAPPPPPAVLAAPASAKNWGRQMKFALLAGAVLAGGALVVPRPAQAVPHYVRDAGFSAASPAPVALLLPHGGGTATDAVATPTMETYSSSSLETYSSSSPLPDITFDGSPAGADSSTTSAATAASVTAGLSRGELATLLLVETPAWQRGVMLAAPLVGIVALVGAAQRWAGTRGPAGPAACPLVSALLAHTAPVHTRRILLPGLTTRSRTVCS